MSGSPSLCFMHYAGYFLYVGHSVIMLSVIFEIICEHFRFINYFSKLQVTYLESIIYL